MLWVSTGVSLIVPVLSMIRVIVVGVVILQLMVVRFVIWVFLMGLGLRTRLVALAVTLLFWAGPGVRLTVLGLSMIRVIVVGAVMAGVRVLKLR